MERLVCSLEPVPNWRAKILWQSEKPEFFVRVLFEKNFLGDLERNNVDELCI